MFEISSITFTNEVIGFVKLGNERFSSGTSVQNWATYPGTKVYTFVLCRILYGKHTEGGTTLPMNKMEPVRGPITDRSVYRKYRE